MKKTDILPKEKKKKGTRFLDTYLREESHSRKKIEGLINYVFA